MPKAPDPARVTMPDGKRRPLRDGAIPGRAPGQFRDGYVPFNATQNLIVRYGCMLLWGWPAPAGAIASADRAVVALPGE